ncbi:olfactory receptor 5B21-like [Hyperolius riggenbachi]|uniref:olfactory receptor 5B21-like n=1 Tax=Hyperolius riggenbachi TaxID=752182 RepID=UPI0035A3522D
MNTKNQTQVTMFVFSGLTDDETLIPFLFTFFFMIYLVTIVGNIGMMTMVNFASALQTPMYHFLSCLSLVDLLYSTVTTPKMMSDLVSLRKSISYSGCAAQFFFFAALAGTEALLLSSMSYDRYAAICYPLHYISIMTTKKCWSLVAFSFSCGFLQASLQTSCVFSLEFCGPNVIDQFYCDIPPLMKLSCSKTLSCDFVNILVIACFGLYSLMTILVTYMLILSSILRIKSSKGRQKAFITCSSHIMCSSVFFLSIFFTYFRSSSGGMTHRDKVASVFYSIVTPMLNPLIYSLRNQEVKKIILKVMKKCN